jgi:threonyl-tRNA synthetase
MRILQLHSSFIEFEPVRKEVKIAEETKKEKRRLEEIVVLFTAVEKDDTESSAERAIEEINSSLKKIKANKILIYPYAHLSSDLARPLEALKILKKMEVDAKKLGIETYRAPFGWCKKFNISIKGHPLAEQSKIILPKGAKKEKISKALKAEEKLKSSWFILQPDGKLIPIKKFDFSKHENLKKFVDYEIAKSRAVKQMPPHVTLMRKLEIADFEPGSDPGNLRFYPKGKLVKSLIENFVTQKVLEYGGMEVETPFMYDFQHPSLASYLDRFPARQYVVKSEDREFFLRFSACFGQFLMTHDAQISYRQLPFKIYELARSFRREKSGELVALRRLRAFTMPDVHAMCVDLDQAKKESVIRFKLCMGVLKEIGLEEKDYELAIRFTKEFYDKNKKYVLSLVKLIDKPVLIEVWPKRFFYFILKWEFNFVDNLNKASALSTDQIDVESAKSFGITYIDEGGKKEYPIVLHCSPSGAIERCVYALLEKAYAEQKKERVPKFLLWLSPIQVRIIPLSDKYVKNSEKIAEEIEKNQIRIDIDDRRETVEKKIRDAELEWVPYILVIGPKEIKSKKLAVRIRETGKIKQMKTEQLVKEIKDKVKDKPFKSLSLPKLLSQRPIFVG